MPFRHAALVLALLAASSTLAAQPRELETTLFLQEPVENPLAIDRVVYRWSTFVVDGQVWTDDVVDLSMHLFADGAMVYEDVMVEDGVAQPLGGQPRDLATEIFWDFQLGAVELQQMRNVTEETIALTSGGHFLVDDGIDLPTDGDVWIQRYEDGAWTFTTQETLAVQETLERLFGDGFETGDTGAWGSASP